MRISVNGEPVEVQDTALQAVLVELGYDCEGIVVALNETVVHREDWQQVGLRLGDRLDVLSPIVGG